MKTKQRIRNLDTLEKEIYRLRLEARLIETRLDENFDHLRSNFGPMLVRSVLHCKSRKEDNYNGFLAWLLKNDAVNSSVKNFTTHVADRAAKGIEDLLERLFQKRK